MLPAFTKIQAANATIWSRTSEIVPIKPPIASVMATLRERGWSASFSTAIIFSTLLATDAGAPSFAGSFTGEDPSESTPFGASSAAHTIDFVSERGSAAIAGCNPESSLSARDDANTCYSDEARSASGGEESVEGSAAKAFFIRSTSPSDISSRLIRELRAVALQRISSSSLSCIAWVSRL
jgi:hypothetical protein